MRIRSTVLTVAWMVVTGVSSPAWGDDLSEATQVFDEYCAAARTGDFERIMSLYTEDEQRIKREQNLPKEAQDGFLLKARSLAPDSYTVQHVSWKLKRDRSAVTLYLEGVAHVPDEWKAERPDWAMRESVALKKESGQWKIDAVVNWGRPGTAGAAPDLRYTPADLDPEKTVKVEGRVLRVDYQPAYTLVLLERRAAEEVAVFLPAREELVASEEVLQWFGEPLQQLAPWNLFEFECHPARTSDSKCFAVRGWWIGD
ncbi:hypothetical protein GMSM_15530 [Geomonas sp. Red276]